MQLYCDRCNEAADHPIDVTNDPDLLDLVRDLGYRNVCPGCYDDLVVEANEAREQQADDRRSEHRVAAQVPIRIHSADGGEPHDTVTEDISDNGVQIRANLSIESGSVVHISSGDGAIDAVAIVEVIWHDGHALRAGLRLVETSESWQKLVREYEARQVE